MESLDGEAGFFPAVRATRVEVANSRDMAFDLGTVVLNLDDDKGKSTTIPGKYVVVWKKQNKEWKVEADIFNTDK